MDDKPRKVIVISGKQLAVAVITVFMSVGGMVTVNIIYTNNVDRESNQALCEMFSSLNRRYQKLPPDAPQEAKEFAGQISRIVQKYKCPA